MKKRSCYSIRKIADLDQQEQRTAAGSDKTTEALSNKLF